MTDVRCHPTNTGTDSMLLLLPWQRHCKCSTDGLLFTNVLVNSEFQLKHSDRQVQSTIRFKLQVNHLQWFRSTPDEIWTVALNCNLARFDFWKQTNWHQCFLILNLNIFIPAFSKTCSSNKTWSVAHIMLHITSPQQRWPASVASGGVCFVVYHPRSDSIVRWTIFSSVCLWMCVCLFVYISLELFEISWNFYGSKIWSKTLTTSKIAAFWCSVEHQWWFNICDVLVLTSFVCNLVCIESTGKW